MPSTSSRKHDHPMPDAQTGDRSVTARYSKAKAKDYTDPSRHGNKAKGGPIERRWVDPKIGG